MTVKKTGYRIAVVHGDGIEPEVCQPAVDVITAALGDRQALDFTEYPGGAGEYLRSGEALPAEEVTVFEHFGRRSLAGPDLLLAAGGTVELSIPR